MTNALRVQGPRIVAGGQINDGVPLSLVFDSSIATLWMKLVGQGTVAAGRWRQLLDQRGLLDDACRRILGEIYWAELQARRHHAMNNLQCDCDWTVR